MNLIHRAQEWLADRVSFVQYPNVRIVRKRTDDAKRPIEERVIIGVLSLGLLAAGSICIAIGVFVLYVMGSSLL